MILLYTSIALIKLNFSCTSRCHKLNPTDSDDLIQVFTPIYRKLELSFTTNNSNNISQNNFVRKYFEFITNVILFKQ